jgi:hypothetical protein
MTMPENERTRKRENEKTRERENEKTREQENEKTRKTCWKTCWGKNKKMKQH